MPAVAIETLAPSPTAKEFLFSEQSNTSFLQSRDSQMTGQNFASATEDASGRTPRDRSERLLSSGRQRRQFAHPQWKENVGSLEKGVLEKDKEVNFRGNKRYSGLIKNTMSPTLRPKNQGSNRNFSSFKDNFRSGLAQVGILGKFNLVQHPQFRKNFSKEGDNHTKLSFTGDNFENLTNVSDQLHNPKEKQKGEQFSENHFRNNHSLNEVNVESGLNNYRFGDLEATSDRISLILSEDEKGDIDELDDDSRELIRHNNSSKENIDTIQYKDMTSLPERNIANTSLNLRQTLKNNPVLHISETRKVFSLGGRKPMFSAKYRHNPSTSRETTTEQISSSVEQSRRSSDPPWDGRRQAGPHSESYEPIGADSQPVVHTIHGDLFSNNVPQGPRSGFVSGLPQVLAHPVVGNEGVSHFQKVAFHRPAADDDTRFRKLVPITRNSQKG